MSSLKSVFHFVEWSGKNPLMSIEPDKSPCTRSRRSFLRAAFFAGTAGLVPYSLLHAYAQGTVTMPFTNGQRRLVKFPQKRELILVTMRPPQLETPFSVFNESLL